jgi:hypothetical protein
MNGTDINKYHVLSHLWKLQEDNRKIMKIEGALLGRQKRKGKEGEKSGIRESNRGMNLIKVHCKHVWKRHNETL